MDAISLIQRENRERDRADYYMAEAKKLREALEMVEWTGWDMICPWCGGVKSIGGHTSNCPRQLALGKGG